MSVSIKMGSEETVTSRLRVPEVDLCSDDEKNVAFVSAKSHEKGKSVVTLEDSKSHTRGKFIHTLEPPSRDDRFSKKKKVRHPKKTTFDALKDGMPTGNVVIKCGGVPLRKEKVKAEASVREIIILDTSDESSG